MNNTFKYVIFRPLLASTRFLNSKIPTNPVKPPCFDGKIKVTQETILQLERLSLVDFTDARGISRLEEAIEFAQPLKEVNTKGVEPMFTILDEETLRLAEDEEETVSKDDVLSSAQVTEEGYFVAPPGNIPLDQDPKRYLETKK